MLTVADIAVGYGKYVHDHILKESRKLDRVRNFDRDIQGRPTISNWNVRRKVIKYSFMLSYAETTGS